MAEIVKNPADEYWRPIQSARQATVFPVAGCSTCGSEFAPGARFCHVCGADRERVQEQKSRLEDWLDIAALQVRLGLNLASLVLFIVACACVLAAMLSGVASTGATPLEWQALQTSRIEWLLASVAALLAGILLKKP